MFNVCRALKNVLETVFVHVEKEVIVVSIDQAGTTCTYIELTPNQFAFLM